MIVKLLYFTICGKVYSLTCANDVRVIGGWSKQATLAEDIKDKDSQDPQDGAEEHELIPPLLTPPRTLTAGPAGVFHNAAGDAHFIPDPG